MFIKIQGYLIIVLATWLEICLANLDFISKFKSLDST